MTPVLLVAIGGCLGAIARYCLSGWIGKRCPSAFPYGTLAVNLLGSFLLGVTAGSGAPSDASLFVGTGFMGAFTTFSTFKWETVQLWKRRERRTMLLYLTISYSLGIALAGLGFALGEWFVAR